MKRAFSLFLAAIMFLAIVPFSALSVNAETYSVIELNIPWFCQRQYGDCGIASISMTEAYYHNYGDNSDIVYNAVFNYNKQSIVLSDYDYLGYSPISNDLLSVYNQLKQGNPVIVWRSKSGYSDPHYSVIYGYNGSSSSLEKSGFKVLHTYRNNNTIFDKTPSSETNLQDWLNGYIWQHTIVRTSETIPVNEYGLFKNVGVENISDTTARIKTDHPLMHYSDVGFYIGTSSLSMAKHSETEKNTLPSKISGNSYNIADWHEKLSPGVTYYYSFYVVLDGKEYSSNPRSFTTTGTHTCTYTGSSTSCSVCGKSGSENPDEDTYEDLVQQYIEIFKYSPSSVQKGHAFQRIYKYEADARGLILDAHNENLEASVWKDYFENWTDYIRSTIAGSDLYEEKVSKYRREIMIEVLKEVAQNDSLAYDVTNGVIGVADGFYAWFDNVSATSNQAKDLLQTAAKSIGQSEAIGLSQSQLSSIAHTVCEELDTLDDVFEIGDEANKLFDVYLTYVLVCNFDLATIDKMIEVYESYGISTGDVVATLEEIKAERAMNVTNSLLTYYAPDKIRDIFEDFAIDALKTASPVAVALAIMDIAHLAMDVAGVPDFSDLEKAVFASEISRASVSSLSGIVGRCNYAHYNEQYLSDEEYSELISDYLLLMDIASITTSNTLKWVEKISDELSAKTIATRRDYCEKITGEIALEKLEDAYYKEYESEKYSYSCTVNKDGGSVVRSDPYETDLGGADTKVGTIANGSQLTIVEKYENAYFNVWYKLADGRWIYSANVTLGNAITAVETNGKTQEEAVLWAKDLLGDGIDYDGVYGNQCVDLIYKYYEYLGQRHSGQNACDFITCSLPAGWERINYSDGFIPARGDIAVWKTNHSCSTCSTGWAGHVGIVTYGGTTGFNAVNQNFSGKKYCVEGWFNLDALACVIRPNFSQTSNPFGKVWADDITATNAVIHADIKSDSYSDFGFYIGTSPDNLTKHSEKELGSIVPCLQIFYGMNKWHGTLSPNTTYYYQFYAVKGGETYYTGVYNFTTERQNTEYTPFTNVWSDEVTDVDAVIHASVEYSTYDEFGFYIGVNPGALDKYNETASFKIESIWYRMSGWYGTLAPGTEYFYQIYVVKTGKEYRSELKSFTTSGAHSHIPGETWHIIAAATCIQGGKIAQICQTCGEQINITETEISSEHSYEFVCDPDCDLCGETRITEHTFDIVVIDPTCEYGGYTSYICEVCNYSKIDHQTASLGHTFGEWKTISAPTCTEGGSRQRECSACGMIETHTTDATGHTYVGGVCTGCGDVLLGDLNYDAIVDLLDLSEFAVALANSELPEASVADINGDGIVDLLDYSDLAVSLAG